MNMIHTFKMVVFVVLFSFVFFCAPSIAEQKNQMQESIEEIQKQITAKNKTIHDEIISGKFPVYVSVDGDDKPTTDRIKSLITKKLRDFGDVSIKNNWEDSIASIYIVSLLNKHNKSVSTSATMCVNSEYLLIIINPQYASRRGVSEYVTSYVLVNPSNAFSANINSVVSTFDTDVLEPMRQVKGM